MNSYIKSLEIVLADMYALYLKTQNYHWNVEGCGFKEIHVLFEEHYRDLFDAIDEFAEIIRALDHKIVAKFSEFSKNTNIKDGNENATIEEMLKDLADDQIIINKSITAAFKEAQKLEDEVVASFLSDRMTTHRKNAWMLKSSLCKK